MNKMFILAQFPEEVKKASVSFWYVKEGDRIQKDQPLVEFVTEKTSFTYQSPVSGKVVRILVNEGDDVSNKQKIAEVEME